MFAPGFHRLLSALTGAALSEIVNLSRHNHLGRPVLRHLLTEIRAVEHNQAALLSASRFGRQMSGRQIADL